MTAMDNGRYGRIPGRAVRSPTTEFPRHILKNEKTNYLKHVYYSTLSIRSFYFCHNNCLPPFHYVSFHNSLPVSPRDGSIKHH